MTHARPCFRPAAVYTALLCLLLPKWHSVQSGIMYHIWFRTSALEATHEARSVGKFGGDAARGNQSCASSRSTGQSAGAMPVKAPVAPIWNWTGFYVGANGGYSFGNWSNSGFASTSSPNVDGWLGGLQAGYNWQLNSTWVIGLEGDIQITGEKADEDPGTTSTTDVQGIGNFADFIRSLPQLQPMNGSFHGSARSVAASADFWTRPSWFTAPADLHSANSKCRRRRPLCRKCIEASWAPRQIHLAGRRPRSGLQYSDSQTRVGWTVGAGIEKKFSPNWSAKLEYLYLDFGTQTFLSGTGLDTDVHLRDHIVRIGLNYQFNP